MNIVIWKDLRLPTDVFFVKAEVYTKSKDDYEQFVERSQEPPDMMLNQTILILNMVGIIIE